MALTEGFMQRGLSGFQPDYSPESGRGPIDPFEDRAQWGRERMMERREARLKSAREQGGSK